MFANQDTRMRIGAIAIAVIIVALAIAIRIFGMQGIADTFARTNNQSQQPVAASASTSTAPLVAQTISGTTSATDALTETLLTQYLASSAGGKVPLSNPDSLGSAIAASIQVEAPAYRVFTKADLTTVSDTSAHAAAYKAAVTAAYAPLRENTDPEIAVYTRLIGGDQTAAPELQHIIDLYSAADAAAAAIAVPQSAVSVQLAALNALNHYTASLAALLVHIDDPVASIMLMKDYNEAEQDMFTSFDALQAYLATSTTS